jgi:DNA invertase Pin-like site-specific DNA recombinase
LAEENEGRVTRPIPIRAEVLRPLRVALAARVSTRDKNQDPEVQLVPMREYAARRGWEIVGEYVDQARAADFTRRKRWRQLLADARHRRIDLVAVWKLDRAWRSTIECLNTLKDWEARGVGFVCISQPELDTTTPIGRLLMTVLAAVAEFERDLIRERVLEGLDNARRKGSRLGRPGVLSRPGFEEQWLKVRMLLVDEQIGKREAARRLKIGAGTLARLLEAEPDLELLAATDEALAQGVEDNGGVPKTLPL